MSFSQGHALLVGVGEYLHSKLDEKASITTKDAQSLVHILKDSQKTAYPDRQVQLLTGKEATRENILASLTLIAKKTSVDSTVIILLCGQGHIDKNTNKFYFLPHDATRDGANYVLTSEISEDELIETIKVIPRRKILLIFNTCYSGNLVDLCDEETIGATPLNSTLDNIHNTGEGLYVVSACLPTQKSWFLTDEPNARQLLLQFNLCTQFYNIKHVQLGRFYVSTIG
jgi:uncharacterized caspase-like protein